MGDVKTLIEQGLKYCSHVERYETSKILSNIILINMAGLAGECLLGGLCKQYDLKANHSDILSYISLLKTRINIPDEVITSASKIARTTSMCFFEDKDYPGDTMTALATHLKILKEWVIAVFALSSAVN